MWISPCEEALRCRGRIQREFDTFIAFTDGAPQHFKLSALAYWVSTIPVKFNLVMDWYFRATAHAKDKSDRRALANDKAQDVTIKRLTKNNPTMAAKFDEL